MAWRSTPPIAVRASSVHPGGPRFPNTRRLGWKHLPWLLLAAVLAYPLLAQGTVGSVSLLRGPLKVYGIPHSDRLLTQSARAGPTRTGAAAPNSAHPGRRARGPHLHLEGPAPTFSPGSSLDPAGGEPGEDPRSTH